jgi:hypothetical protein
MDEVDPSTGGDAIVYHSFSDRIYICSSEKTKRNEAILTGAELGAPTLRGTL